MFSKNMIFHQFPTSKKHQKSQKKLPKVSPRDFIFLSHFLSITLGSQSAPPDLHFHPSGIDFGPQIHIISSAWSPITFRSERFTPLRHGQPVTDVPGMITKSGHIGVAALLDPTAFEKDSSLESQSSKTGGGGDTPHGVFN